FVIRSVLQRLRELNPATATPAANPGQDVTPATLATPGGGVHSVLPTLKSATPPPSPTAGPAPRPTVSPTEPRPRAPG
ncbi:MAG TPA: hypothetical protein PKX00_13105, partial [Opitutaceae bacterium]|nr:hypothetical protein [Opitutaceae bacterium]